MRILVLNPGSSSLKYHLYDARDPQTLNVVENGVSERIEEGGASTVSVVSALLAKVTTRGAIDAVGYRVVHGADRFTMPTLVDDSVLDGIRALGKLAPLHNPVVANVIAACRSALPEAQHVAVFDTAFHRTLPPEAFTYAIPFALSNEDPPLRRYGFHGIAHASVSEQLQRAIGGSTESHRLITCHLGNGASVCAIHGGRSIDTSMGLTPLEGLVMGTRSGDIDPALVLHLLKEGRTPEEVDRLLNHDSGLEGISGISSDLRDLEKAAALGGEAGERARLAMDVFAYRVAKYIGAYAVALGGVDAIGFSGGIGEHSAAMRERILRRLLLFGVAFDSEANQAAVKGDRIACITTPESRTPVWVVPVDEDVAIARATLALAGEGAPGQ